MGWLRGERRGWSLDAWGGLEGRHEWRIEALIGEGQGVRRGLRRLHHESLVDGSWIHVLSRRDYRTERVLSNYTSDPQTIAQFSSKSLNYKITHLGS